MAEGRLPSTEAPAALGCCVAPHSPLSLRILDVAPIAAPGVEQVVVREIIDGLPLGPRLLSVHSAAVQPCATSAILYRATAK